MTCKRLTNITDIAAKILFLSDRACCVCRKEGKPIQIHHIDGDNNNNHENNLAVLCLDCHRDTQISGGFDRKLDAGQVLLYRDDWINIVARKRAVGLDRKIEEEKSIAPQIELRTSLAEIYRENKQFELLAMHYDVIGNTSLRDKYINIAIEADSSDQTIIWLRALQKRPDLIPKAVIKREIKRMSDNKDWTQLARLYISIEDYKMAAKNYVKGIATSLDEGRIFSAAYYLKETIDDGVIDHLFEEAYRNAKRKGDFWWQIRALQELGWEAELKDLLVKNRKKIKKSKNPYLNELLCKAENDTSGYIKFRKIEAEESCVVKIVKKRKGISNKKK